MHSVVKTKTQFTEKGSLLIEVLVGISLMSVMALALIKSSLMSLQMQQKAVNDSIAAELALGKIEEFSAVDPATLSDGDTWEEVITQNDKQFDRVTEVSVNDDNSRTVTVTVTAKSVLLESEVTMSNTFPLRES